MTTNHLAEVRHFASFQSCLGDTTFSDRTALMSSSVLFAGLSTSEYQHIASCARSRTFARDELLYHQGQPVQSLMLIVTGCVKLTQLSSAGSEVILWVKGKSEPVGICGEATGHSRVHTCSARAMDRCTALAWEHTRMQVLLEQFPRIKSNVNQILSSRLHELEERFREIATERVSKRLAMALVRLSKQVGTHHESGTQVSMSRGELAQVVGTNLFTTSRILSKWNELGVVFTRREAVIVRDVNVLQEHAYCD